MKNLLVSLLLVPALAWSNPNARIDVMCVGANDLAQVLVKYGEKPFVQGIAERDPVGTVIMLLFVNPETGSWTLVEKVMSINTYCVINAGDKFKPIPKSELEKSPVNRSPKHERDS